MSDFEETQRLIRLKRYEQPPEDYFEGFLDEFHERQRSQLMKRSSRSLFFERVSAYLSDMTKSRWLMAGGAAYAVLMLGFYMMPAKNAGEVVTDGNVEAAGFDAPQGQVTPVHATASGSARQDGELPAILNSDVDLFEGIVKPIEEGRAPFVLPSGSGTQTPHGDRIIEL